MLDLDEYMDDAAEAYAMAEHRHAELCEYPGPSDDYSVWVTGSGEKLPLKQMGDLHLARALAKCVEKSGLAHPRTQAIVEELMHRSRCGK